MWWYFVLILLYIVSLLVTYKKFTLTLGTSSRKELIAKVLESGIELWGGLSVLVLAFYFLFISKNEVRFWQIFWVYFVFLFLQSLDYIWDYFALKRKSKKHA